MYPKYEEDYYGWITESTKLMREGKLSQLDIDHLIEEMELMGASIRQEFLNRLVILITHLLKWQYQPNLQGKSWQYTIKEQRYSIKELMEDNPSLKSKCEECFLKAYKRAGLQAERETGLNETTFPSFCPYTLEQCLDEEFYPEGGERIHE
jgi:hypothetical protein